MRTPSPTERPASAGSREELRRAWARPEDAERYAGRRFATRRARERDPRLVAALLGKALRGAAPPALVLDAPCGAGRLRPAIEGLGCRHVGLDVSPSMLAALGGGSLRVRGDLLRLPFADAAFPAVVACRFLHHLRATELFEEAVRELVRVSAGLVVASFWDAASLPELRPRAARRPGRVARSRAEVRRAFLAAGAAEVRFRAVFRFVSRQTFCVARVTRAAGCVARRAGSGT